MYFLIWMKLSLVSGLLEKKECKCDVCWIWIKMYFEHWTKPGALTDSRLHLSICLYGFFFFLFVKHNLSRTLSQNFETKGCFLERLLCNGKMPFWVDGWKGKEVTLSSTQTELRAEEMNIYRLCTHRFCHLVPCAFFRDLIKHQANRIWFQSFYLELKMFPPSARRLRFAVPIRQAGSCVPLIFCRIRTVKDVLMGSHQSCDPFWSWV